MKKAGKIGSSPKNKNRALD